MRHKPLETWEALELMGLKKNLTQKRKLSDSEIRVARCQHWLKNTSIKELAEQYGTSYDTMRCVIRRARAYADGIGG